MSASNLPPGVSSRMIEDAQGGDLWDQVVALLAATDFDEEDTLRAVTIGIAAVNADRFAVRNMLAQARQEGKLDAYDDALEIARREALDRLADEASDAELLATEIAHERR